MSITTSFEEKLTLLLDQVRDTRSEVQTLTRKVSVLESELFVWHRRELKKKSWQVRENDRKQLPLPFL